MSTHHTHKHTHTLHATSNHTPRTHIDTHTSYTHKEAHTVHHTHIQNTSYTVKDAPHTHTRTNTHTHTNTPRTHTHIHTHIAHKQADTTHTYKLPTGTQAHT